MLVSADSLSNIMSCNLPNILLWSKDLECKYIQNNPPFAKFFGFNNSNEMTGISDYNLRCPAAELAEVFQFCDKQVASNKETKNFFEILKSAEEEMKAILVTKAPIVNAENRIVGTFGHAVDITHSFFKLGCILTASQPYKHSQPLSAGSFTIGENKAMSVKLTTRQSECLFFLLRHKTVKQIASILNLSIRTIDTFIEQLKMAFDCYSKSALLEKALSMGFLHIIPKSLFSEQLSIVLDC